MRFMSFCGQPYVSLHELAGLTVKSCSGGRQRRKLPRGQERSSCIPASEAEKAGMREYSRQKPAIQAHIHP